MNIESKRDVFEKCVEIIMSNYKGQKFSSSIRERIKDRTQKIFFAIFETELNTDFNIEISLDENSVCDIVIEKKDGK